MACGCLDALPLSPLVCITAGSLTHTKERMMFICFEQGILAKGENLQMILESP
jgi:hypothetical protein